MSDNPTEYTTPGRDDASLTDRLISFYRAYYKDEIGELAQKYPQEQRSLEIEYSQLHSALKDVAEDWLKDPEQIREYAEEALRQYDLPADMSLDEAHIRLVGLPDERSFYPGGYRPSKAHKKMPILAIRGEINMSSDVNPSITDAAFECQRCGTMNYIPQEGGDFQEPHDCQGCEREGPFKINFDQSEFVDFQKIRVAEPPEVAAGEGQTIDCYLEDDLAGQVQTGDRVVVNGLFCLERRDDGSSVFDPYIEAESLEVLQSDETDMDIKPEERKEIQRIVDGEYGDPIDVATESIAPKIYGFDRVKRAMVLGIVGGSWLFPEDGDIVRGSINILVLGDPSTGKSKVLGRASSIAPRSVDVTSTRASVAGLLASAVRDDFSEAEWTLKAGAFVKASGGLVAIDEIDDMDKDVRAAMLEPMANSKVNISMAGINTTLPSHVAVMAVGNPTHGRFNPYEPISEQFDFNSALLSRFDLIYTVSDSPDYDDDKELAGHVLENHDLEKRKELDDRSLTEEELESVSGPIDDDLLTKWFALAKDQPEPTFASEELREDLAERYAKFRTSNDDVDSPIPIAARKLNAITRLAEAAAKLEFSEQVEERHVEEALARTRDSLKDVGMNEEGQFDADVIETGTSTPQRSRIMSMADLIEEMDNEYDSAVPVEDLFERAEEIGLERDKAEKTLEKLRLEKGWVYEPEQGKLKWVGK